MQNTMIIRGLPRALERDGWWLTSSGDNDAAPPAQARSSGMWGHPKPMLYGLIGLIALADLLFWGHRIGLSLALFSGVVFAVATWDVAPKRRLVLAAVFIIAALPIIEYVQGLSMLILAAGLGGTLVAARYPQLSGRDHAMFAANLMAFLPIHGVIASIRGLMAAIDAQNAMWSGRSGPSLWGFARNWAFPVGGALVFSTLLIDANPVLGRLLEVEFEIPSVNLIERILFWTGMALLIWPLLSVPSFSPRTLRPAKDFAGPLGINAGSTVRALWVFNALIAVQTVLDLSIFLGGAALPDGMSYATYAHRGAYPLLITAILAGSFAVLARPFLDQSRWLKPLMLLWLAQNVALCVSAMVRLDLYIDIYGLTYLRIHAMIWIALVALCLSLCAWQAWRARSTGWLVIRAAALGAVTVYVCTFINFAGVIAGHNLAHIDRVDYWYLCKLGPTAHHKMAPYAEDFATTDRYIPDWCDLNGPEMRDWQEWGFRNWRVQRNLATLDTLAAAEAP